MSQRLAILILISINQTLFAQSAAENDLPVELRIDYLPPSAFSELPQPIADELGRRECDIPQVSNDTEKRNVVSGQFAKKGQQDWAILCSRNGVSEILIFWKGNPKNVQVLAPHQNTLYMQQMADGYSGYFRQIDVIKPPKIQEYVNRHQEKTYLINHEGIHDAFVGKTSVIRYFSGKQWNAFQAAD